MTIQQAIKLHPNDEVFWNDPDNGLCSRHYLIAEIDIQDGIVRITEKDGSYLECSPRELT
jgi:hypothetical protein